MPSEYVVRVTHTPRGVGAARSEGAATAREYRFAKLPITLGRAANNDVPIAVGFVSSTHASIEESCDQLCVRDLGSRNGVQVPQGDRLVRIPARSCFELSRSSFSFYLGTEVRVQVEHTGPRPTRSANAAYAVPSLGDGLPPLPEVGRPLRDLPPLGLPSLVAAPAGVSEAGAMSLPALPPLAGGDRGVELDGFPAPARSPSAHAGGFEPVRPAAGLRPEQPAHFGLATGNFTLPLEVLALQGLRELVASLTPGRPLETQGDVARLITRLHDTIEVICRSFLPVREAYSKFVSSFRLDRSAYLSEERVALDRARDPGVVAEQLLDFREGAPDAGRALEAALKDVSLHQVALLDGVMQGIRALLEELSPDGIARQVEERRSGLRIGRGERELWAEYCARYEQFSDESEAFARVFGEEFTRAYREYRRRHRAR